MTETDMMEKNHHGKGRQHSTLRFSVPMPILLPRSILFHSQSPPFAFPLRLLPCRIQSHSTQLTFYAEQVFDFLLNLSHLFCPLQPPRYHIVSFNHNVHTTRFSGFHVNLHILFSSMHSPLGRQVSISISPNRCPYSRRAIGLPPNCIVDSNINLLFLAFTSRVFGFSISISTIIFPSFL